MFCPICYSDNKSPCYKFLCSHSTCKECFESQIRSSSDFCCCLCRAGINCDSLDDDEKKLFLKRYTNAAEIIWLDSWIRMRVRMRTRVRMRG